MISNTDFKSPNESGMQTIIKIKFLCGISAPLVMINPDITMVIRIETPAVNFFNIPVIIQI